MSPTHADDCELMLRTLDDGPNCGLSMTEIQVIVAKTGQAWSLIKINEVLCAIRPHIRHEKVRRKQGKVTLYTLRSKPLP